MREIDKCPELERLPDFIDEEGPVPRDFIAHAQTCEICAFWLSYSLALIEAFGATTRIFALETVCPKKEKFRDLLWQAIRTRQIHPSISEEVARSIQFISGEEAGQANKTWDHLNECELCHDYYYALYDAASRLRKKYLAAIQSGKAISPWRGEAAKELSLREANYVAPQNPNGKPN